MGDSNAKGDRPLAQKLTHRFIEALPPAADAYSVRDLLCPGLSIRVAPGGDKSFGAAYRIRGAGKMRRSALGKFPAIALEAARERARSLVGAAQAGRDLLAEEAAVAATAAGRVTVGGLIETYLKEEIRGKRRTAHQMELMLRRALKTLREKPAEEVTKAQMRDLLKAVANRGAPREAENQRQTVGRLFRWAIENDHLTFDPTAGIPSFGTPELRDRTLSTEEVPVFWSWVGAHLFADYRDALHLQLALGTRIGEVTGLVAEEINVKDWLWTLPALRSKNQKPRVTPIIGMAREILERRLSKTKSGPLFTTERGVPMATLHVTSLLTDRRNTIPLPHFTSHDLRRTTATGMVELGIPFEIVAAVIGHEVVSGKVRILAKHYLRSALIERKRAALQLWNDHLARMIAGTPLASNVVPLSWARIAPDMKEVAV